MTPAPTTPGVGSAWRRGYLLLQVKRAMPLTCSHWRCFLMLSM